MKTNHTPGPWHVDQHMDNGEIVVKNHDDDIIANCEADYPTRFEKRSVPVMKANAKLIAAAPDLLDALLTAQQELYAQAGEDIESGRYSWIDEIIKKATT